MSDSAVARKAGAAHPWQRGIALAALTLPAPPAVMWMIQDGRSAPVLTVALLMLAVPPALRANRAWFMTACLILAVALLGYAFLGVMEGALIFLPSALLLPCANFADPRQYRTPATVFLVLAGILSVLAALVGWWELLYLLD
ncbi:hypothetical protein [Streptomyces sp. NBC_00454]|uniref:hypothetical protein n=1 Tax=Streptomyces sp. NBC_00454 TaxID=2975747 RepID=UPI0030E137DE